MTDIDGKFSIQAAVDETLEFTYLGYTKVTHKVKELKPLTITMSEDAQMVDEVVVVGYGVQKKETVTGAISSVNTKDLVQSSQANISNALVGRLPGLTAVQNQGNRVMTSLSSVFGVSVLLPVLMTVIYKIRWLWLMVWKWQIITI